MGLLTVIRKIKQKENERRILFLGLDNAGKTSVVKRLKGEDIQTISPTLGFNIETFQVSEFKMNIWDIGGQTSLRGYWRNYYEQTDGLVWVIDSCDVGRIDCSKGELFQILREEKLGGCPVLILANKIDLPAARQARLIVEDLQLASIGNRNIGVFSCSAISGSGLKEAIDWLVDQCRGHLITEENDE